MENRNKLGDYWDSPAENTKLELEQWQWGYKKLGSWRWANKVGFSLVLDRPYKMLVFLFNLSISTSYFLGTAL